MDVTLSDDEVQTLRGLFHDYLPALKFEAARTDGAELRHLLVKRQRLCERLLERLPKPVTRSARRAGAAYIRAPIQPI